MNGIAPSFISTDMATQSGADFDANKAMMRRVGTPDDIAAAAAFLASEEAGFVTAQLLTVDGDRTDFIAPHDRERRAAETPVSEPARRRRLVIGRSAHTSRAAGNITVMLPHHATTPGDAGYAYQPCEQ